MSASTGALARLLEQHEKGSFVISGDEACLTLIGLAPDAVRLLTDMAAALENVGANRWDLNRPALQRLEESYAPVVALLARFAALEQEAAQ